MCQYLQNLRANARGECQGSLGSLRFNVVYLDLTVVDDRPFVADLRQKIVHALLVLALAGIVRLHDVDEVLWRAVARLQKNLHNLFHIRHRQCYGPRDRTRARTLCCFGLFVFPRLNMQKTC